MSIAWAIGGFSHFPLYTFPSFLTPARRDGATVILVGDLSNKQREEIYDTLSIPPTQLAKKEFVSWCHGTLGRAHDYTFLAFLKEQRKRQLFLTRAGSEAVEDLGVRLEELSMGGGGGSPYAGGGGGSPYAGGGGGAEEAEDEDEPAAGGSAEVFRGDRRRLQGGSHQGTQQDLYTTHPYTLKPLLPVIEARFKGGRIWETCLGLGNIATVLDEAGYTVVGTDLYTQQEDGTFTMNKDESFIECVVDGVSLKECAVPEGVSMIITNPPFSEKLAFIKRFYELGLPTYCLLPVETLGVKGCAKLFEENGGVEIFFLSGKAASTFFKVSEGRDVSVGSCAWFGFNTRKEGEENFHHFL